MLTLNNPNPNPTLTLTLTLTIEEHRKNEQKTVKIATFFSEKLEEAIPR